MNLQELYDSLQKILTEQPELANARVEMGWSPDHQIDRVSIRNTYYKDHRYLVLVGGDES